LTILWTKREFPGGEEVLSPIINGPRSEDINGIDGLKMMDQVHVKARRKYLLIRRYH
jgi:hypothetical protein